MQRFPRKYRYRTGLFKASGATPTTSYGYYQLDPEQQLEGGPTALRVDRYPLDKGSRLSLAAIGAGMGAGVGLSVAPFLAKTPLRAALGFGGAALGGGALMNQLAKRPSYLVSDADTREPSSRFADIDALNAYKEHEAAGGSLYTSEDLPRSFAGRAYEEGTQHGDVTVSRYRRGIGKELLGMGAGLVLGRVAGNTLGHRLGRDGRELTRTMGGLAGLFGAGHLLQKDKYTVRDAETGRKLRGERRSQGIADHLKLLRERGKAQREADGVVYLSSSD